MIKLNNSELQTVSAGYDFSIKATAVSVLLSFTVGLISWFSTFVQIILYKNS